MKNSYFALFLLAIISSVAILFSACTKINASTDLGGGLIPPIDNVTTFDTSITVQTFNDTFGLANDSLYLFNDQEHFVGVINSDPFFGKTDARLFLELKPFIYGIYPFTRKDSVKIDSIVLVLDYQQTYGDSNTAQAIKVYEIDPSNKFSTDSFYLIRQEKFTYSTLLSRPGQTFIPRTLDDSVKAFKDITKNQLRIKLDTTFARRLFNYDTSNAYKNDSIFKKNFKGFAIRSEGAGNAIMGFNLRGVNTKLAIYYNCPKVGGGGRDTTVNYFSFSPISASANYIKRDYAGTPMVSTVGGAPDQLVYIQGAPGTFTTIKIPDLSNVSNRLIHRAEPLIEQVYNISDTIFSPPIALYLDAVDPTISTNYKFRTIPYDLVYTTSGLDLNTFGSLPVTKVDAFGNRIRQWRFDLSRYIQHVLTRTQAIYDFRLSAPFAFNEQFGIPPGTDQLITVNVNPSIALGRVRLGGGNHPTQRMRLRLIYSKL